MSSSALPAKARMRLFIFSLQLVYVCSPLDPKSKVHATPMQPDQLKQIAPNKAMSTRWRRHFSRKPPSHAFW